MLMKVQAVKEFGIGDIAKQTGLTARAIRFYEDRGLVAPTRRGLTRLYTPADLDRILGIISAAEMGFSIREIREMIDAGKIQGKNVKLSAQERVEAIAVQDRVLDRARAAIKALERT